MTCIAPEGAAPHTEDALQRLELRRAMTMLPASNMQHTPCLVIKQNCHQTSVAFCSPATKLAFSGLMENPLVGKQLKSKQNAPKTQLLDTTLLANQTAPSCSAARPAAESAATRLDKANHSIGESSCPLKRQSSSQNMGLPVTKTPGIRPSMVVFVSQIPRLSSIVACVFAGKMQYNKVGKKGKQVGQKTGIQIRANIGKSHFEVVPKPSNLR